MKFVWSTSHALNLTIFVTSLLISLITAEFLLRAFYPIRSLIYRAHNDYLYALEPGARTVFQRSKANGGDSIFVRINSRGFRGPELTQNRTWKRIVVYGDSFIEAKFSQRPQTLVGQLKILLEKGSRLKFEVINAGVSGYGPGQILKRIRNEVPYLHPDLVIISIYAGNDFSNLLQHRLVRLSPSEEVLENPGFLSPSQLRRFAKNNWRHPDYWMILRIIRHQIFAPRPSLSVDDRTHRMRLETCMDRNTGDYQDYVVRGSNEVSRVLDSCYAADVALRPSSNSAQYRIKLMRGILQKYKEAFESLKIKYLFVIIPAAIDLPRQREVNIDRIQFPAYQPTKLTDLLESMLKKQKMPYVNLYDIFSRFTKGRIYFKAGDDHWNDTGQVVAAEVVYREISQLGLVADQ